MIEWVLTFVGVFFYLVGVLLTYGWLRERVFDSAHGDNVMALCGGLFWPMTLVFAAVFVWGTKPLAKLGELARRPWRRKQKHSLFEATRSIIRVFAARDRLNADAKPVAKPADLPLDEKPVEKADLPQAKVRKP